MEGYRLALRRYAVFNGRSRRREFWGFQLVNAGIIVVIAVIDSVLESSGGGVLVLSLIYGMATFLPGLAVLVRRLHDTNRSGWFALLWIIPFIGVIVLIILTIEDSWPSQNSYGSTPKPLPA
jgi:uncharacterized membrane protein YhaH (DUF805 family)